MVLGFLGGKKDSIHEISSKSAYVRSSGQGGSKSRRQAASKHKELRAKESRATATATGGGQAGGRQKEVKKQVKKQVEKQRR